MKRLVLDTELLVFWIVGNLDPKRIGARRLESFSPSNLERLNEIVKGYEVHVSTPNILTEASNFIGSGKQQLCKNGCAALGNYISKLEEVYVPSRTTLQSPMFASFGLADATLFELASKRQGDIWTVDGPLFGRLVNSGVPVSNFWHEVVL